MAGLRSGVTDTMIFDIDGTLVDSNYQTAIAWYRAFRRHEIVVPIWQLHRAVGMGGDQLVAAVAGDDVDATLGDALRKEWGEEFEPLIGEIVPFAGVTDLLADVHARGVKIAFASSGKPEHVEHYVELVGAKPYVDAWTTSQDVEKTKPAPGLVEVALSRVNGTQAVMVGDSIWDAAAAKKVGIATYGVRSGGSGADELIGAGAVNVYDSVAQMRPALDVILG
jgi:HAD superfamily hydrolase (TIGR01549 family)